MDRIIRIEANSNLYAFNQEVSEKKAERVLKNILKSYNLLRQRHGDVGKLKVTTSVVNPELF